jgi:LytS/YehU family sensor histidine kinase
MDKLTTAYLASLQGALAGAALAGSFKLFKYYYVKERHNQQLQKENMEAQLQLLKAQVHPHFLFNTLNNIYSQAQEESPRSAKMTMELSHILRYLLHEGREAKVPLENELQMMSDYISLEKIRYDEKLDIHVSLPEKTDDIYIAPLLLLPLVENCFKHGASKMIHHPWINVKMELHGKEMFVKIINGKKDGIKGTHPHSGTGIENVKQRLQLLYKDKHEIQINEDEEVFVVNLRLELEKIAASETNSQPSVQEVYA